MACRRSPAVLLCALVALAAAAVPFSAGAQTYDVELKTTLNDLPVSVETVPMSGVLTVRLTNQGTTKVRCDLRYDAAPQPIGRGSVYVEPGKTEQHSFQARRNWFTVAVEVTCKPAEE